MACVKRLLRLMSGRRVIRRRVIVHGRVQGVFFRVSCRDEARRIGVAGTVRNMPDGTVEAVIEGRRGAVEALIDWCRTGPKRASVRGVDVFVEEPSGAKDFVVLR